MRTSQQEGLNSTAVSEIREFASSTLPLTHRAQINLESLKGNSNEYNSVDLSARRTQASTNRAPYHTQDSSKKTESRATIESARSPDVKISARSPDVNMSIT